MANLLKHAPDLAIPAFDYSHLIPRIRRVLDDLNLGWGGSHSSLAIARWNRNSRTKLRQSRLLRLSADLHQVSFRYVRSRFHQLLRQTSVVRKQQYSFAGIVESSDGIDPAFH